MHAKADFEPNCTGFAVYTRLFPVGHTPDYFSYRRQSTWPEMCDSHFIIHLFQGAF